MHRKFIATIAAASILITGFGALPARAGDEDVARALAAFLGLAIVGAAIHDANKDKKHDIQVHQKPHKKVYKPAKKKQQVKARPLPRRVSQHLLPGRCLRSFDTRNGTARIFGRGCLKKHYSFTHQLPRNCERRVRVNGKARWGFGARCLRKHGYRLARS